MTQVNPSGSGCSGMSRTSTFLLLLLLALVYSCVTNSVSYYSLQINAYGIGVYASMLFSGAKGLVSAIVGVLLTKRLFVQSTSKKGMLIAGIWITGIATICLGSTDQLGSGTWFLILSVIFQLAASIGFALVAICALRILAENFQDDVKGTMVLVAVSLGTAYFVGPAVAAFMHASSGFMLPNAVLGLSTITLGAFVWRVLKTVDTHSLAPSGGLWFIGLSSQTNWRAAALDLKIPIVMRNKLTVFFVHNSDDPFDVDPLFSSQLMTLDLYLVVISAVISFFQNNLEPHLRPVVKRRFPASFDRFHPSVREFSMKRMAGFAVTILLLVLVVHPDASAGRCHVQDGRLHCTEACNADAVRASDFDGRVVLTGPVLDFGCLDFFGIKVVELLKPTRCKGVFIASAVNPADLCVGYVSGAVLTEVTSVVLTTLMIPTTTLSTVAATVVTPTAATSVSQPDLSVSTPLPTAESITLTVTAAAFPSTSVVKTETTTVPANKPSILISVLKNFSDIPETTLFTGERANVTLTFVEGKAVLGAEFSTEVLSKWAVGLISGLSLTVFGLVFGWLAHCLRKKPWLQPFLRLVEEARRVLTLP
ncbi:unnamed protein product, partial [Notodromas monacha]